MLNPLEPLVLLTSMSCLLLSGLASLLDLISFLLTELCNFCGDLRVCVCVCVVPLPFWWVLTCFLNL